MDQIGYLVKLPDGSLGWHLFSYQRMLKSGKHVWCRIILLDYTGLRPKQTHDGRFYVSELKYEYMNIIGGLFK